MTGKQFDNFIENLAHGIYAQAVRAGSLPPSDWMPFTEKEMQKLCEAKGLDYEKTMCALRENAQAHVDKCFDDMNSALEEFRAGLRSQD